MTTTGIPRLITPTDRFESQRLVLRSWQPEDIGPFVAMHDDAGVMRYFPEGRPLTPEEGETRVARMRQHWDTHSFGHWAIEEKASGRFVGRTGAVHNPGRCGSGELEIGWTLARPLWGLGYASEAATRMRDWAFACTDVRLLFAMVMNANERSLRVARRIGMTYVGEFDDFGVLSTRFEFRRPAQEEK